MNAICAICDELIAPAQAHEHFSTRHPDVLDWSIKTWDDGTPVLIEDPDEQP